MQSAANSLRIETILRAVKAKPILSVSEAAAIVDLSTSRLRHLFQAELGTSLRAYKKECRLQLARKLLKEHPTIRIKEARCLCGIPDASNFTHLFKQRFGVTPSVFRVQVMASNNESNCRMPTTADSTNK